MPSAGFAYARWSFEGDRSFQQTTEEEESDAFGGLRLRTVEIFQAIAIFNESQRRREYRGGRERCLRRASPTHGGDLAIAFLPHIKEEERSHFGSFGYRLP